MQTMGVCLRLAMQAGHMRREQTVHFLRHVPPLVCLWHWSQKRGMIALGTVRAYECQREVDKERITRADLECVCLA